MTHGSPWRNPEEVAPLWRTLAGAPALAYRLVRWRALRGGWLLRHLRTWRRFDRARIPAGTPIDVLVLVTDHFEPARRHGHDAAVASVASWCDAYEALARHHRDSDGRPPQHTWFYRFDYPNPDCVRRLSESVYRGFGEVEFHLHHGHDTHASFSARLRAGLNWFSKFGAMRTAEEHPRQLFGYIAGNSALDNGDGDPALSGCDTEIAALRDAGCFADFTFPALGSHAQPPLTNGLYYVREDGRPRSYAHGQPAVVGRPGPDELMIFQGPTAIDWPLGRADDGCIEDSSPAHPIRLAPWLQAHVHVPGRPEWVFVKLTCHAMQNRASFLSAQTAETFAAMEYWWDRPPFRLHYVTAREAFNVVKAAEAGHTGNPDDFRDFLIPPPANRLVACDRDWRLETWSPDRVVVRVLEGRPARVRFATGLVGAVAGTLRTVEVRHEGGKLIALRLDGDGSFEVALRDGSTRRLGAGCWQPAGGAFDPHEALPGQAALLDTSCTAS
jgi:hypothetical protein